MQKSGITLALILFISFDALSQPWANNVSVVNNDYRPNKPANFYEIKEKFYNYWKDKEVSANETENAKKGGHQQFKRWEYLMKQRTYPTGDYFDSDILAREFENYKQRFNTGRNSQQQQINAGNWTYIGQTYVPTNGGGCGRINVMRIHPTDPNTLFVGSASGGFWKTTDGGFTWTASADLLPSISISDIAVNPINPDIIYIATGDGYGYEVNGDFWGGVYTGGIYKSTDGGVTWNATTLSYQQQLKQIFNRIIINPNNPDILLTASRNFLFRSTDGGTTWSKVSTGRYFDLEFKPGNPNIVYAAQASSVYKSVDGGLTFAATQANMGTGRMSISVTPANPNVVYAMSENGDFWKSTNEGVSYNFLNSPQGSSTFYGYYDNVLGVSPVDEDFVVTGGVDVLQSTDGGNSWGLFANGGGGFDYVHVDQKSIEFSADGLTAYACNDGGIFKTEDGGLTWADLGDNIHIKQYYKMATGVNNTNVIYAGAQDNGTDRTNGASWDHVYGGDGMDCAVDPLNSNIAYYSSQYGNFVRTLNASGSEVTITPAGQQGAWVTPIAIDPTNTQTIYIGYQDLYRSFNRGTSWTVLANNVCIGNDIEILKIAPSNTNVIYAGYLGGLFKSTDGGLTFTNISNGLIGGGIMDVAISSSNPDHIWVTLTGYAPGRRIYRSVDGGTTYSNVSGSLPAIPVNCAIYQPNSNDMVYIGTDFGVFYRDNTMPDWLPFNTNLPNVIISEFEVLPAINKLRAATYGRGLWQSDMATSNFYTNDAGVTIGSLPSQFCITNPVLQVNLTNYGSAILTSATITYTVDNSTPQSFTWTGSLASLNTISVALPSITFADGLHTIAVNVSQPNSSADQNNINDDASTSILITTNSSIAPVTENFESGVPVNFRENDPFNLLNVTNAAGGFGNSTRSIKADCYQVNNVTGEIISNPIDMTTISNNGLLTFDVAHARFTTGIRDSLLVFASTDCGLTWTNIYQKQGTSLSTVSGLVPQTFVPQSFEWRNEQVSLNNYLSSNNLLLRFKFRSSYGNNIYVDNINILQGSVGLTENNVMSFDVFPNPVQNRLFVRGLQGTNVNINLFDITGKLITGFSNIQPKIGADLQIDLPKLSAGFYTIQISDGDKAYQTKRFFVGNK